MIDPATDRAALEPEAERLLVGSVGLKPSIVVEALAFGLRPSRFNDPLWRLFYSTFVERHMSGQPSDVTIVAREVRDNALFAGIEGGAVRLLMEAGNAAVSSTHWRYHAERIIDAAAARDLRRAVELEIEALRGPKASGRERIVNLSAALFDLQRDYCRVDDGPYQVFDSWEQSVINRERPKLFECADYGSKLRDVPIGEGLVTTFGAPPGGGKTALVMQLVVDALLALGQSRLKALVGNVEMSPQALWNRLLARLTGVGHQWILHRDYEPGAAGRLQDGINQLRELLPRLEFMRPPFELERLTERADAFQADIVVVDYAQRFDFQQRSSDQRSQANAVMDVCRRIADQGRAVVVVSAVNRAGYARESAGLASFRESSELEYGSDACYLLIHDEKDRETVTLKCVKNRHGALSDIPLRFDGSRQHFTDDRTGEQWTG